MKKLFFVILLLSATQAISQNVFSIQELIDIYLTDKEGAIKSIEAKGYAPGNSDQFREMFGRLSDDNQVFFRGVSILALAKGEKVSGITLMDSISVFKNLLIELRNSGLDSVNIRRPYYEVYTKRKLDYFVWYEIVDSVKNGKAIFSVRKKNKGNEILYRSRKKQLTQ